MRRAIKASVVMGVCACALAATTGFAEMFTNTFTASEVVRIVDDEATMGYTNNFNAENFAQYTRAHESYTNERACLINFGLSAIPGDAVIHAASVTVWNAYITPIAEGEADPNSNGTLRVDMAALLLPWNQSEATGTNNLTGSYWNELLARASTNVYAYDGAADRGPVEDSLVVANPAGAMTIGPFDVTVSLVSQIANNKRYGWILHGDMASAGAPDGFAHMGLNEIPAVPPDNFGLGYKAPRITVIYEADSFDMMIEGSDDPNWTLNNLSDFRTSTLLGNVDSNKYRVILGSE